MFLFFRFPATGNSFTSIHLEFLLGKYTFCDIVHSTCEAIWRDLKQRVMRTPSVAMWIDVAELFWSQCNFPNCLGMDGKHIRIQKPMGSGSKFFNYEKYFSVVLLAVVDADYCFAYIDVGVFRSSIDSSKLAKILSNKQLYIPPNRQWPATSQPAYPFVLVGDEAFDLGEHLIWPSLQRGLTPARQIFIDRLARAQKMVMCLFGLLANNDVYTTHSSANDPTECNKCHKDQLYGT